MKEHLDQARSILVGDKPVTANLAPTSDNLAPKLETTPLTVFHPSMSSQQESYSED